jgi:hypothetical protein
MLKEKQYEDAKKALDNYTQYTQDFDPMFIDELAAILQPQPAPLPEDAIEAADKIYESTACFMNVSSDGIRRRKAGLEAVLRNFAQRPDVLGPVSDEELGGFDAGNGWLARTNAFLGFRRNNLFAPKEPSLEEQVTQCLSDFVTPSEIRSRVIPERAAKDILALIQHQQGKGKE